MLYLLPSTAGMQQKKKHGPSHAGEKQDENKLIHN